VCAHPVAEPGPGDGPDAFAEATPTNSPELRTVTVLFADLVGFTALAEAMEPDDVHELVERVFAVTDRCIAGEGGQVDRHIGDAVLGVFGAAHAQEDDPARAIRAALRIQAELGALSVALPTAVRIGINSGRVLIGPVGGQGAQERTVYGDAVNVAARLQSVCPPSGVLISHTTFLQAQRAFAVEPQEPIQLKGKSRPIKTYLVAGERAGRPRPTTQDVLGWATELIGRADEIGALTAGLARCVALPRAEAMLVSGPPGLGKTRLLEELIAHACGQHGAQVWRARAAPETAAGAYDLLGTVLKTCAGIRDAHTGDEARERLLAWTRERLVRPASAEDGGAAGSQPAPFPADYDVEAAHFIGEILGIPFGESAHVRSVGGDARQVQQRAFLALERVFVQQARRQPLILALDDLQWADWSSLAFFQLLLQMAQDASIFLVATARPEFFEDHPEWDTFLSGSGVITLAPLPPGDSLTLCEQLLRFVSDVPTAFLDSLARRSEGNPYFAEEMVKCLADDGRLVPIANGWAFRPHADGIGPIPPTVEGLLQSRLDHLGEEERAAARMAAVIGRVFWDRAVMQLAGDPQVRQMIPSARPAEEVSGSLELLIDRGIVKPMPASTFAGCREYVFVHDLMRDVVYRSLTKRTRRQLHLVAATWLEDRTRARQLEWLPTVATHYAAAGDAHRAATCCVRAAEAAAESFGNEDALRLFARALELGGLDRPERARVLLATAGIRTHIGDWERAQRDLEAAEREASAEGLDALTAGILSQQSRLETMQGNFESGLHLARKAFELAQTIDAPNRQAVALTEMAEAHSRRGQLSVAMHLRQRVLEIRRQLGDERALAQSLFDVARNADKLGKSGEAMTAYRETLERFRCLGDRAAVSYVLHCIACIHMEWGELEEALAPFEESLELRRAIGDRPHCAWNLHNMALIHAHRGELARALALNEEAMAISRAVGNHPGVAYSLVSLAQLDDWMGQSERAKQRSEEALTIFRAAGELPQVAVALGTLAEVHWALGDVASSLSASDEACAAGRSITAPEEREIPMLSRAKILVQAGAFREAQAGLHELTGMGRKFRTPLLLGQAFLAQAQLAVLTGALDAAREQCDEALRVLEPTGAAGLFLPAMSLRLRLAPTHSAEAIFALLARAEDRSGAPARAQIAVDLAECLLDSRLADATRRALVTRIPTTEHRAFRYRLDYLCARLQHRSGNPSRARELLDAAQADVWNLVGRMPGEHRSSFQAHPWVRAVVETAEID
jgi:class 3 adenylate cyclase/predicted ATPase